MRGLALDQRRPQSTEAVPVVTLLDVANAELRLRGIPTRSPSAYDIAVRGPGDLLRQKANIEMRVSTVVVDGERRDVLTMLDRTCVTIDASGHRALVRLDAAHVEPDDVQWVAWHPSQRFVSDNSHWRR